MLETVRRGLVRGRYEITEDGHPLAELTGTRSEGCEFTLVGRPYVVERPRRKQFVLNEAGTTLATAEHQRGKRWTLRIGGGSGDPRELTLTRPSWWRSRWDLVDHGADATVLGSFRRVGPFGRRMVADVPATLGHPVRLFAFYVVIALWQREQAAAASASSSGG